MAKKLLSKELQSEINEINRLTKIHPDAKPLATQLISKLKAEAEGRGVVSVDNLERIRKGFKVMTEDA